MIDLNLEPVTLLIIDDSEGDRLTYSRYLQSDSAKTYRIIEAETLEDGLELWRSQQPDIVLIDLNLPDGDGLEFLEAINDSLLERSTEELQCTVEELRVTTEDLFAQQRQLENAQLQYQNLFNFAPDGYLVTDISGKILDANQVVLEMLAISRDSILTKPLTVFVDPYDKELFYRQLNYQSSPNYIKQTWEITLINRQGGTFLAEIAVTQYQSC